MVRLHRSFRWANVILIFVTFLAYLSPYIHPATLWPFAVLGLIYPVLLLLNLFFIGFWVIRRRRYAVLSLACIILGWMHFTAFVGLHIGAPRNGPKDAEIKVLTYNVYGFYNRQANAEQGRVFWTEAEVLEFYRNHQPDIWCLQEFATAPKYANQFKQLITQQTPLKHVYFEPGKGLAIFSRYPLKNIHKEFFGQHNRINGFLISDIEKDGQSVRLINVHLQSNAVSGLANEVAENGQLREKETWLNIKGMISRYRRTAVLRSDQAREIREYVEKSPHPVILCGDFNDVPLSYAYRQISTGLIDGFRKRGQGLGTTYRGSLPALRIDYVLTSPEISPLRYQVLENESSDHYPVLSTLKLEKP